MLPSRIILVEDNPALRDALTDHLQDHGFRVQGVSSGLELDQALREETAQALILDVKLPGEDGIAIAKRMRKAFPTIGIMLVSASVQSCDRGNLLGGADLQLAKPFSPENLTQAVHHLCALVASRER
jgi:DNA-binding response OmpR family regulator